MEAKKQIKGDKASKENKEKQATKTAKLSETGEVTGLEFVLSFVLSGLAFVFLKKKSN